MTAKKVVKRNRDRSKRVKDRRCQCVCEWCGVAFLAARRDATTCSDSHRLKWSRWAKKFEKVNSYHPGFGPRGNEIKQRSADR